MLSLLFSLITASGSVNGAAHPRRGLDQLVTQCNHDFAYTFDDGPYIYHSEIMDSFEAVSAKTTFFMNGNLYSCIYDEDNVQRLRDTLERGHMIGSHTWSHPHLPTLSEEDIDIEIERLDEAFVKILGLKPKFLRPPYGDMDERTAAYIQSKHGKVLVNWSEDANDWAEGTTGQQVYDFYSNFAHADPKSPHLTLSHETVQPEIEAVRNGTAATLVNGGVKLITVGDCLDITGIYEIVGAPGVRDETWTCNGTWTPPSSTTTIRETPTTSEIVTRSVAGADADPTVTRVTDVPIAPTVTRQTPEPTPSCVSQYTSASGDTCTSIGSAWGLTADAISAANTFLNCNDIWSNTPICIPYPGTQCSQRINTGAVTTCQSIGAAYGVSGATILLWNYWLNCDDIWAGTAVCVSHRG